MHKWEYTPTYRGFDTFYGYYNAAEDYYTHRVGKVIDFRNNTNQSLTRMDFIVPTYLLKQYKKLLRNTTVIKDLSSFMLLINLCMNHWKLHNIT